MDNVRTLESLLSDQLGRIESLPCIGKIRQKGLMVGVDLCDRNGEVLDPKKRTGHRVCMAARKKGVIYRPLGDTLVMMPPLCMNESQVHRLIDVLMEVLDETI